jgi:hypothetical protein
MTTISGDRQISPSLSSLAPPGGGQSDFPDLGTTSPIQSTEAPTTIAAVPLLIGGGIGLKWLAAAVAGGVGIGWSSLSSQDQKKLQDAIGAKLNELVQNGRLGLGKATQLLTDLVAGGLGNAREVLSRHLGQGLIGELQQVGQSVLQATATAPSPAKVAQVVSGLNTVNQCRPKDPDDLGGMCGECTTQALAELRKLKNHPDPEVASIARNAFSLSVRDGGHFVIEIMTTAGKYILDCTFGQFPGARELNGGQNVFFGAAEKYFQLLQKAGRHTPF